MPAAAPNAISVSTDDRGTTTISPSMELMPAAFRSSLRKQKRGCKFLWNPSPNFASARLFTRPRVVRAGGGQVNVVSKSGSNQFHGSAFDYLRNDMFDSRSPF